MHFYRSDFPLEWERVLFMQSSMNIRYIYEINHGSQNVLGVLTWIGGY